MNYIEILEKLKDEQYTKKTVNTLYEFYNVQKIHRRSKNYETENL